ncbi:glutathione S-transferase family protein [Alcanivorax sp. DP30]|uniref:glutathione S-transferase family protein n=1 Tax=Alcanivorax sp. DP30 TaxID=2606217 RepID=UPI00136C0379|nr:glutathione S-transferase [Alcanivorax sp. DP30]MZR63676.1 glutathione S-transferase [Alcanivorax sp. DP30]
MITVHHLENSRSLRIVWMLEELGVEYQIKHYKRDSKTMLAPAELRAIHPLGKSPVITDGDNVIAESGAIIEYLAHRYGDPDWIIPASDPRWQQERYWLHYAEGSLMPLLVMKLIFSHIPRTPMPFFAKPVAKGISGKVIGTFINPQLQTQLDVIEKHLASHTWFTGDAPGCADIMMSFPLQAASARADIASLPSIARFLQQMEARPAYQRAVASAGPLTPMA